MANASLRHFYNKILFCDTVGFSRLAPVDQFNWQDRLTRALITALHRVDARLGSDVVALSTGDGAALNFLVDKPDVHLRAALYLLEDLHSDAGTPMYIPLRIGLNSFVDTLVPDLNGMSTVVGDGINTAQRVMDLAGKGQILLHERVRVDLASFQDYQHRLLVRGEYTVKHGVRLPIAQFIDPKLQFVSNHILESPPNTTVGALSLDQILVKRITENVLSIVISNSEGDFLPEISDYVAAFLETNDAFRSRRFAVAWLVAELADNSLRHGGVDAGDSATVKIARTTDGLLVTVDQPDRGQFSLREAIADPRNADSFLQMMSRAGLRPRGRPVGDRLEISIEIPNTTDFGMVRSLTTVQGVSKKQTLVLEPQGRIDEGSWQLFAESIALAVRQCEADGFDLLIDLSSVSYMSSRGLRALSTGLAAAKNASVNMVLASPGVAMLQILAISRYDKLFRIYNDVAHYRGESR